ncbi:MAG: response regulator [Hyphomicrobiaceae bacterium]|nr:response regulator [Hyphomicrobiaceae bacterium]
MNRLQRSSATRPRVLIVDDDPIFRTMAASCLSVSGLEAVGAGDGVEALDILDRQAFDLALIDLSMPRVDGFRLIGLIRGTPALARLSILVLSARLDIAAFNEALALGANAFQTKPIDWRILPLQARYLIGVPLAT